MADVKAVRAALLLDAALLALVPAARILAGRVPLGMPLPAVSIKHISAVPGAEMGQGKNTYWRARVQVAAVATSYPAMKQLVQVVQAALHGKSGRLAGVAVTSITLAMIGPDPDDDGSGIFDQGLDFTVLYMDG